MSGTVQDRAGPPVWQRVRHCPSPSFFFFSFFLSSLTFLLLAIVSTPGRMRRRTSGARPRRDTRTGLERPARLRTGANGANDSGRARTDANAHNGGPNATPSKYGDAPIPRYVPSPFFLLYLPTIIFQCYSTRIRHKRASTGTPAV